MGRFSLGGWFMVMAVAAMFIGCDKRKPPVVIENPLPPKPPSKHKITEEIYAQFTWGRVEDTFTLQEPDELIYGVEGLSYDTVWANVFMEAMNVAVIDTMDTDIPIRNKAWLYCPATSFYRGQYLAEVLKKDDPKLGEFNQLLYDSLENNSLTISFPYVTDDTLQFWDIKDYIANPTISRGQKNWGRIGDEEKGYMDARTGAVVSYLDDNGEFWSSDNDPNFQPFGYFVLDKVELNKSDTGELASYYYIAGRFEARLYNDVGYWKDMKNGRFKMRIITIDEDEQLLRPVSE